MTIERARKLTVICYVAAIVLLIVQLVFPLPEIVFGWFRYGFFALVAIGFLICYSNCRCPRCNRVIRAGFRPIDHCPFCNAKIQSGGRTGR